MIKEKVRLTKTQLKALRFLYKLKNGEWTNKTPVNQRCLNVLSKKGLVFVALDKKDGFCERITPYGKQIMKLK